MNKPVPVSDAELIERLRLRAGFNPVHPSHTKLYGSVDAKLHCEAANAIAALRQQNAELRKDAERYRWLRSESPDVARFWLDAARNDSLTLDAMDYVIDIAKQAEGK